VRTELMPAPRKQRFQRIKHGIRGHGITAGFPCVLELGDFDADELVFRDDLAAAPQIIKRQAAFMHIIRGDDARIQNVTVQMHIDRPACDCRAKPRRQIAAGLDMGDAMPVDQVLLERVQIALPHQNDLIQPQSGAKAGILHPCRRRKGQAAEIAGRCDIRRIQIGMGIEPDNAGRRVMFGDGRQGRQ